MTESTGHIPELKDSVRDSKQTRNRLSVDGGAVYNHKMQFTSLNLD